MIINSGTREIPLVTSQTGLSCTKNWTKRIGTMVYTIFIQETVRQWKNAPFVYAITIPLKQKLKNLFTQNLINEAYQAMLKLVQMKLKTHVDLDVQLP